MSGNLSTLPIATIGRQFLALSPRLWRADKAGDDLPLLHRLAIIYLMVPVIIWLVGWFQWWFGIPAAILFILALRPALSGSHRLALPQPMTLVVLLIAAIWVMCTAAGGVFDTHNWDWHKHRSIFLNLGYYPWPTFLPDPLAAYLSPEFHSPFLLRFYLGWYIVPGSFARLIGPAALNWAVPIWTWLGVALILLLFVRERRGWAVILALVVFVFFSGMDSLRSVIVEGIAGFGEYIGFRIELKSLWSVESLYKSNTDSLMWAPQHFVPAGLYTFLLLQLRRQPRFLGVSAVLLAPAPFWSPFVAIGLLPFVAALLWKNGFRPFLVWSNLLLAAALGGLIAIYLTSGALDSHQGWIWERYEWPALVRWIPLFYLTEFLLLVILLCAMRPSLLRKPFFIASLATLILLPLYLYGDHNDLTMRGSLPAILVLCYYCTETISDQARAIFGGTARWWKRLGVACIGVTLAVGSLTVAPNFERATASFVPFRYDLVDHMTTLDVHLNIMNQYLARDTPTLLRLLLSSNESLSGIEKRELVIRTHNVYPAPPLTLVFSADTLATLAAARRIVRSEQESVFVAGDDYDEHWMRPWLQFIFSNRPDDAQHFRTLDHSSTFIFPPDHTGATYLFDFELPPAYILDRYFDASLVQTIGTSPSGRPIILHHLQEPRPPFEPQWPLQARFDDQILVYGFDLSGDAQAGVPLTVRWYWRILADEQRVLAFSNQLFGDDGERRGHLDAPGYDPNYWPVGTTGITLFQIDIDPETPTGAYWLRLATYDRGSQDTSNLTVFDPQGNQAGKHLSLGPIKVHGRPPGPSSEGLLPSPIIPDNLLPTTFADQIGLLGYNLSDHSLVPGQSLDLTLFWSPRGRPSQDYTVFVHLLDSQGQLRGQADSPPTSGKYPTSVWDAGEVISDIHILELAPELPIGDYTLVIGLYYPGTGNRLSTIDENGQTSSDHLSISGLVVEGQ